MNIGRFQWVLAIACGLFVGQGAGSVWAEENQKDDAGHDHKALKVEMEISDSLAKLNADDRKLAEAQRFCPVMEYGRLGSMGTPTKVMIEGKPAFVCCKDCVDKATKGGKETLEKVATLTTASAVLAKLSPEDKAAAEAQKYCAVAEGSFLGGMGSPIKLTLNGKPVFLCCKGCTTKAQSNPEATLAKVDALKKAGMNDEHGHSQHKEGSK